MIILMKVHGLPLSLLTGFSFLTDPALGFSRGFFSEFPEFLLGICKNTKYSKTHQNAQMSNVSIHLIQSTFGLTRDKNVVSVTFNISMSRLVKNGKVCSKQTIHCKQTNKQTNIHQAKMTKQTWLHSICIIVPPAVTSIRGASPSCRLLNMAA